jgi:N-acetylneuraminic acid mutarotase
LIVLLFATLAAAAPGESKLSFADRTAAAEALERARFRHRVGANAPFESLVPKTRLEEKVRDELRQSVALSKRWGIRITDAMLREEVVRMSRDTRMPERLRELFDALSGDPFLIKECLARPIVVDRLAKAAFSTDPAIHATARRQADALRRALATKGSPPTASNVRRTVVTGTAFHAIDGAKGRFPAASLSETPDAFVVERVIAGDAATQTVERFEIQKTSWDEWWGPHRPAFDPSQAATLASRDGEPLPSPASPAMCAPDNVWDNGNLDAFPAPRAAGCSVWTGVVMILWGGFSEIGRFDSGSLYDPATDTWHAMSRFRAPEARASATAVWTGKEMIVWGGEAGKNGETHLVGTGGRYDPLTDRWTAVTNVDAPEARLSHAAVWTGTEMIVWGGKAQTGSPPWSLMDGGRYDPASDSWRPTSPAGAPAARQQHGAVWTGTEMVVWGGWDQEQVFASGGRYNPISNSWRPTSTNGAPAARVNFATSWTGTQMLVWGGVDTSLVFYNSGGRYDPGTDTWSSMSVSGAPPARVFAESAWSGSEMLVFGGEGSDESFLGDGARYDPILNRWRPMSRAGSPSARIAHFTAWTGDEILVWGGGNETRPLSDGRRYRPSEDRWVPMSGSNPIPGRSGHAAMWTGDLMLFWGGYLGAVSPSTIRGIRYDPATDAWSEMSDVGAPESRLEHSSAVWTGREMIVFGGTPLGSVDLRGWRYDPTFDTWTSTSTAGSPTSRFEHTAVWTGREVIVWGGDADDDHRSPDGGRYDPSTDHWSPMPSLDPSLGRTRHIAVWTGSEMLVWGGWTADNRNGTTGALFNPEKNSWRPMSTENAPESRQDYASAWTGRTLVVWGGHPMGGSAVLDTGARYDPALDVWLPMSAEQAPSARAQVAGVWNGAEVVVWGGSDGSAYGDLDTGGLYDPVLDGWRPTNQRHAPEPRTGHSATWTGSFVMIWGGGRGWFLTPAPNLGGRLVAGLSRDDDGDGYTECGGDCNDSDDAVHPGAIEICNGLDDDCDGVADLGLSDSDGDGVPACTDDCLAMANPGQEDFDGDRTGDACELGVLLADVDNSRRIDGGDLAALGRAFGSSPPASDYDARADLDRNGIVDGNDLAFLTAYWGRTAVP